MDVQDRSALEAFLEAGDVIVDAAGPFQRRSPAVVEAAMRVEADVVDLSDSAGYARMLGARRTAIEASGVAVLTGCSAISAVVAAAARASGIEVPVRVDAWLAPASRETANAATARALLASLTSSRTRRCDVAAMGGIGVESALGVQLPVVWPSLREAAFWVDPHVVGLAPLLRVAARVRLVRTALAALVPAGVRLARLAGTRDGTFAVRVEGDGRVAAWVFRAAQRSYIVAVAPAVLAARDLATGRRVLRGLVPADEQVGFDVLATYLHAHGVRVERRL